MAVGEGYQFAVLGDHHADVELLVDRVRSLAETEIARRYLEPASHRAGWVVGEDDEVAGRRVWNDEGDNGKPYIVVIDGRTMSSEELGMALEPYEGWGFRLVIEDRVHDARTERRSSSCPALDVVPRMAERRPRAWKPSDAHIAEAALAERSFVTPNVLIGLGWLTPSRLRLAPRKS